MKEISNLIERMKPSGIRQFFNYASERPDIISLGVGEPDFVTPKPIIDAAKASLDEGKTFYTSNQGLPILREKILDYKGYTKNGNSYEGLKKTQSSLLMKSGIRYVHKWVLILKLVMIEPYLI